MAYCRWSTEDFECEVYAYQDIAGGFTIHLASNRRLGSGTPPPSACDLTTEEFLTALDKWTTTNFAPLELPQAGDTIRVATLGEFLAQMQQLRKIGYQFPDYVLEDIQAEIDEYGEDFGQDSAI
jgi:hypothetical protein